MYIYVYIYMIIIVLLLPTCTQTFSMLSPSTDFPRVSQGRSLTVSRGTARIACRVSPPVPRIAFKG